MVPRASRAIGCFGVTSRAHLAGRAACETDAVGCERSPGVFARAQSRARSVMESSSARDSSCATQACGLHGGFMTAWIEHPDATAVKELRVQLYDRIVTLTVTFLSKSNRALATLIPRPTRLRPRRGYRWTLVDEHCGSTPVQGEPASCTIGRRQHWTGCVSFQP